MATPAAETKATKTHDESVFGLDQLQTAIERIEAQTPADDGSQAQLLDAYKEAVDKHAIIEEWRQKAEQFQQAIDAMPDQVKAIQKQLSQPPDEQPLELLEDSSLNQANQRLEEYRAALDQRRSDLSALVDEGSRRIERKRQIAELIETARKQLDGADAADDPTPSDTAELIDLRRMIRQLNRQQLQAEIDANQLELSSYDAGSELLTLKIDLAGRQIAQQERQLDEFQKLVDARSRKEELDILRVAREARDLVPRVHSVLSDAGESIVTDIESTVAVLSGQEGLLAKTQAAQTRLDEVKKQTQELENSFAGIQRRIKVTGHNSAVGRLLRRQNSELPDLGQLRRENRTRIQELGELDLRRIELEDQRRVLGDIEASIERILSSAQETIEPKQLNRNRTLLRQMLANQTQVIDSVSAYYHEYAELLFDLNLAAEKLTQQTQTIAQLISEQVLWIRSAPPLGLDTLRDALAPTIWILTPAKWLGIGETLRLGIQDRPLANGITLLVILLLILLRPRLVRAISTLGEYALTRRMTEFAPTIKTLVATLLVAALWPVLLWSLSRTLDGYAFVDGFALDVAFGSKVAAATLISLELLRRVARKNGLAQAHFRWPEPALTSVCRHFAWFAPTSVLCVFAIGMLYSHGDEGWTESLGRLLFIAEMLLLWSFLALLFPRHHGLMENVATLKRARGRRVFLRSTRLLALFAPLCLIVTAGLGYGYTAIHLGWRLYLTGCLMFGLGLVAELISRALRLARRRIAIEQAEKRLEALKQQGEKVSDAEILDQEIDLATVNTQSDRLLRSSLAVVLVFGLWFVWADVIPALGVLDEVQIGQTSVAITTAEDGTLLAEPVQTLVAITLKDLFVALLIAFITIGAIRNLPGLVEMTVLTRMRMPAGERHATTTILRYTITILGIIYAFDALGIGWSNIQWLVAAMGLGLGFGLQEIFANFISGIIILFERPIRVGDTVTIGDISGTVTKIRIRATTITDFDRKDLIVPNKEFVTGKLINWTRTDSVLRVKVAVGIAYGSDTKTAIRLLKQVAADSPLVLENPDPQVFFHAFGDSTLDFELWAYCDNVDNRFPLTHDLHLRIDQAFRDADIEIAFPQRDIHVRSVQGLQADIASGPGDIEPMAKA